MDTFLAIWKTSSIKMKRYKIAINKSVYPDLENIANFILSKYTRGSVDNYLKGMYEDISTLNKIKPMLGKESSVLS